MFTRATKGAVCSLSPWPMSKAKMVAVPVLLWIISRLTTEPSWYATRSSSLLTLGAAFSFSVSVILVAPLYALQDRRTKPFPTVFHRSLSRVKRLASFYSAFSPSDRFRCDRQRILAAGRLSIPGRAISAGLMAGEVEDLLL